MSRLSIIRGPMKCFLDKNRSSSIVLLCCDISPLCGLFLACVKLGFSVSRNILIKSLHRLMLMQLVMFISPILRVCWAFDKFSKRIHRRGLVSSLWHTLTLCSLSLSHSSDHRKSLIRQISGYLSLLFTFDCLKNGSFWRILQRNKMGTMHRSGLAPRRTNENAKVIITTVLGILFGTFIGISLPSLSFKINLPSALISSLDVALSDGKLLSGHNDDKSPEHFGSRKFPQIYVPTNPRGAELLPPGIVVAKTDFYLRRLWGEPNEDLKTKPKYLVTFTVGFEQRNHINTVVKKFSEDFQILLFHYDGRTTEWDQFEWSKSAIHISTRKQTKWWYAKRFLHPDVVSAYEYIFIWDEDLGVEHFNADKYIQLVKKHGLEISQPGLEPNNGLTWEMTKRRGDREVHKDTKEKAGWCSDPHLPPCAAFVEIMAPVFSREAWRCVWHMIQNDLVHGWGLDFALRRCVEPAHEKIGVVDSQWIIHKVIPSLGSQGKSENGKAPWQGVRERCKKEWTMFQNRLAEADKEYLGRMVKG